MIGRLILAAALAMAATPALPHDIYSGVHGKDGQLCCGADDCFRTTWREHGETFDFLLPDRRAWVTIDKERITFLPIAGDDYSPIDGDAQHYGHVCYRPAADDETHRLDQIVIGSDGKRYRVWCAFIPPGGV